MIIIFQVGISRHRQNVKPTLGRFPFGVKSYQSALSQHPRKVEWNTNERKGSTDVGSWVFYANEAGLRRKNYKIFTEFP